MDLLQLKRNLLGIDIWEILKPILVEYLPEMVDANTRQLGRGELNDGDLLEAYKSEIYLDFKLTLPSYRAPAGIADLFVTGDFYSGFFAEVNDQGVLFGSKDGKTQGLEGMYSSDIFGLQPKEWEQIKRDHILPRFIEELEKAIFKSRVMA